MTRQMQRPIDPYDPDWAVWNAQHPHERRSLGAAAVDDQDDGEGDENDDGAAAAGADGAAAAGDDGGAGAADGGDGAGAAAGAGWLSGLSEDAAAFARAKGWDKGGPDAVIQSYRQLERKVGGKGVTVPGKNATEEEREEFYKAVGRPDTPEGYEVPIPEGVEPSEAGKALQAEMLPAFHEAGLTAEQAKTVAGKFIEAEAKMREQHAAARKAESDRELSALQKQVGEGKWDDFKTAAQRGYDHFFKGDDDAADALEAQVGTSRFMSALARIGEAMGEDGPLDANGVSRFGSPEAAKSELAQLKQDADFQKALTDSGHPEHKDAVKRWNTLIDLAGDPDAEAA